MQSAPPCWLLALLISGCASPPLSLLSAGELGFRSLQNQGFASIQGRVSVPAALLAQAPLDPAGAEVPLAGALIDLLDAQGQAEPGVKSAKSDSRGHFGLSGAPRGIPGFLRARFQAPDGQEHALYAFVRPDSDLSCVDLSFVSTLLAKKLAQNPSLTASADPAGLDALLASMRAQLPFSLGWLAKGEGLNLQDPGALQTLLEGLTEQNNGLLTNIDAPDTALDHLLDWLFANTPGLADGFSQATLGMASVEVSFSLQGLGRNQASYPHAQDAPYLMRGQDEIFWRAPAAPFSAVTFSLNAQQAAAATFQDGAWRASIDTRSQMDGPGVLVGAGRPLGSGSPVFLKAYVYILNQAPAGTEGIDATCAAEFSATAHTEGAMP